MVAAASASRTCRSSTTATSVRARPLARPPALRRSEASALTTSPPVVSHNPIIDFPPCRSGSAPASAFAFQHFVGRAGAPLAGPVGLGGGAGPGRFERVDDVPTGLDLGRVGEQGLVADEHVEDEPLVGLGAGVGERLAV